MTKKQWKKAAGLGFAVFTAFSLAACGSKTGKETENQSQQQVDDTSAKEEQGDSKSQAAGDGVLKVRYSGTPEIHEKQYLMDNFFKEFEKRNNCKVEVDFLPQADAIKKVQAEQKSGNVISDILYVDTANMAPYIQGEWMQDISAVVDGTGSTYTDMFDSSTNKDGLRYFVPMSFDVYVTVCNVKALAYLPDGLTEEDVVKGITWEQYADWAIAIAAGEGEGKTMMPANMTGSQLLYPMGGLSLAYGGAFPEFTSEGFKEGMEVIAKIAKGNGFYTEQDQYTAPTEPLNSQDVWLTFAHMGPVGSSYNAAPNNFVIGAAPKGSKGAGSTSGAWCYGIAKGAPHQELAEAFIAYIAEPEVNYDFCYNYGGSLSPIEEVGDILDSSDVVMRAGIEMLGNTIVTGVPASEYSDWNAVKLLFGDIFNEMLKTGEVPSDDFLGEKQEKMEALKN